MKQLPISAEMREKMDRLSEILGCIILVLFITSLVLANIVALFRLFYCSRKSITSYSCHNGSCKFHKICPTYSKPLTKEKIEEFKKYLDEL